MVDISAHELRELTSDWLSTSWLERAKDVEAGYSGRKLSEDALKYVASELRSRAEKGHVRRAANWIVLVGSLTEGQLLHPRFGDALRPATYDEGVLATLRSILGLARSDLVALGRSAACAQLESLLAYCTLYWLTRQDEAMLIKRIHDKRISSLISLLVLAESRLGRGEFQRLGSPRKSDYEDLGKEEVASGVSYLLEAYNKRYGLGAKSFSAFQESDPGPTAWRSAVVEGFWLRELVDLEAAVYRLGYQCTEVGANEFRLTPPSAEIGAAISLGYVVSGWQTAGQRCHEDERALSFEQLCREMVKAHGEKFFIVLPGSRGAPQCFRTQFPLEVAALLGKELLVTDKLFREELPDLRAACQDLRCDFDKLWRFPMGKMLTVGVAHQIQRVFRFLAECRFERLASAPVTGALKWNAEIGVMSRADLVALLKAFGITENDAKEFLDLWGWDASKKEFLDLQYTPIIMLSDRALLPFKLLSYANLVRNGFFAFKRRLGEKDDNDRLAAVLDEAFSSVTSEKATGTGYSYQGQSGDIDFFVILGGKAFAFECKDTILPASHFELRTTWDYVNKGASQLRRLRELWKEVRFREHLASKTKLPLAGIERLETCIVLGHRLLSGATVFGHPVRHVFDLAQYVREGTSFFRVMDVEVEVPLRRPGPIQSSDLLRYLEADGGPAKRGILSQCEVTEITHDFGSVRLTVNDYGFDIVKWALLLDFLPAPHAATVRRAWKYWLKVAKEGGAEARQAELAVFNVLRDALRAASKASAS